jgi:hypothetical protein
MGGIGDMDDKALALLDVFYGLVGFVLGSRATRSRSSMVPQAAFITSIVPSSL